MGPHTSPTGPRMWVTWQATEGVAEPATVAEYEARNQALQEATRRAPVPDIDNDATGKAHITHMDHGPSTAPHHLPTLC